MLPIEKLEAVARRFSEVENLLCSPSVQTNHQRLQQLNKERSEIEPVIHAFHEWREIDRKIKEDKEALADPDLRALAEEELPLLEKRADTLEENIRLLLLPTDPNDKKNVILEIRSGEGGEEAALFARDLFRMYARYAETQRWKVEILNVSESQTGGYKEAIASISGNAVYSKLRFEAGVHRVQRVPATETQGRIHTSTATVAVMPEAEEVEVQIDDKDLKIDIAASGGPGGQGVNTTNSAVQITHLPSGMIVKCQDERSQLKNKAKALKILRARLLDIERDRQDAAISAERRTMVGTGERSQKIRTYNFPQNRVTDHRIGLTLHKLDRIVEGDLDELISQLRTHRQAGLLFAGGLAERLERPSAEDDS
jgi:peptide chain release factor 1